MTRRASWAIGGIALAMVAGSVAWWQDRERLHFLPAVDPAFAAGFAAPPARDSPQARRELEELLAIQRARSPADIAAARADRRTRINRFYGALGLDAGNPPDLELLEELAGAVEDDVRIYVRHVKEHYRRLRPYEIDARLEPCIDNVRGDQSYPSGHAAYGWAMAYLLADMVPARRGALERRAAEFARQRMVCGVHFPSDLEAGRLAAAQVMKRLRASPRFREEAAAAAAELTAALQAR